MTNDYLRLMLEESRDLVGFLATLSEPELDAASLCDGWRVRDVAAHMAVGHTTSIPSYGLALLRFGLRTDAAAYALAKHFADTHSTEELLARFRAGTSGAPASAARLVRVRELFTDHLVHHQDMRRPLGRPREIPPERLLAALDSLPTLSSRVGSRGRIAGLRLVATDVDFNSHSGSDYSRAVLGPAEAIVLAACGRDVALDELEGPGADELRRRLAPAAATLKR